MTARLLLVASAGLVVAACATTAQEVAKRYDGVEDLERFRRRYNDCQRMTAPVVNVGPGLIPALANLVNLAASQQAFKECMADAGYRERPYGGPAPMGPWTGRGPSTPPSGYSGTNFGAR